MYGDQEVTTSNQMNAFSFRNLYGTSSLVAYFGFFGSSAKFERISFLEWNGFQCIHALGWRGFLTICNERNSIIGNVPDDQNKNSKRHSLISKLRFGSHHNMTDPEKDPRFDWTCV